MLAFLQENVIPELPLRDWTNSAEEYITNTFEGTFNLLQTGLESLVSAFEQAMLFPPELVMVAILTLIALLLAGWRVAIFALIGFVLIISLGL